MESVGILADEQDIYKVLDDLAECQRYDRKVIALQTKDRDSDDNAEDCCHSNSDEQRQEKSQRRDRDDVSHAF